MVEENGDVMEKSLCYQRNPRTNFAVTLNQHITEIVFPALSFADTSAEFDTQGIPTSNRVDRCLLFSVVLQFHLVVLSYT